MPVFVLRTVGLLVVDVDDRDQVIELEVAGGHDCLPDGALIEFAIGKKRINSGFGPFALQTERPANSDAEAQAERSTRHLHTGRVGGHAGHRQPAFVEAVRLKFCFRNDAGLDQCRIKRDGIVPIREQEPVSASQDGSSGR